MHEPHEIVSYIAVGISCITLLYFGLHGMLLEKYLREEYKSVPRLRYNKRHKCFYVQRVCKRCGRTVRHRLPKMWGGGVDVGVLEVWLDDTQRYEGCRGCWGK